MWFLLILLLLPVLYIIFPPIMVCGDSMFPTYNDGDILIGCRFFKMKISSVYVFHPPLGEKYVVKRLTDCTDEGLYFEGDNKKISFDSRYYGCVERREIVAKCLFRIYHSKKGNS